MPESINWLLWGRDVFKRALGAQKPVILYLTAPWSGWGYIMDSTTFQEPEVVHLVQSCFLPVKINVDRYPHISDRYHCGGFPSIVFLSPEGYVLWEENYLPSQLMVISLKKVLQRFQRGKLKKAFLKNSHNQAGHIPPSETQNKGFELGVTGTFSIIQKSFDAQYGGFVTGLSGGKFPYPEINDFLIRYLDFDPSSPALLMLTKTLDAMYYGELHDGDQGGFYRYCESGDWTVPHYEKMLETNAGVLKNYLASFHKTGTACYLKGAQSIINYLMDNLYHADTGTFGGSQAGEIDFTSYAGWNSIAASSFILAGEILENKAYLDIACGILDFLWGKCYRLGKGVSHFISYDLKEDVDLFTDQVKFASSLIDAYECTGKKEYLQKAEVLAAIINKRYWLKEEGFSDIPVEGVKFGLLNISYIPFCENAEAAIVLVRLAGLSGKKNYASQAEEILRRLSPMIQNNPVFAAKYGQGILELHNCPEARQCLNF